MTTSPKTHLTWSIEVSDIRDDALVDLCPCGGDVILVVAPDEWPDSDHEDYVSVNAEVSAHVCKACGALVSLSLNVFRHPVPAA